MDTAFQAPEFKLLLSCCRLIPTSAELVIRDGALLEGIDSGIFLDLVERHRVAPIVYLNLQNDLRIDDVVRTSLLEQFNSNRLFALRLKMWQKKLANVLEKNNLSFVFLKGIPLAEQYYGDLAARHSLDIDLLVEREELHKVVQLLLQLGFHPDPDVRNFQRRQMIYFTATNHDLAFHYKDGGFNITVELHWRYRGAMRGFNLSAVRQLDNVEEFLYLCTHGTEHAWFRMKWLFDMVQIIQKNAFDWIAVHKRAQELDCVLHLEMAWLTLQHTLGLPIPGQIENRMRGETQDRLMTHIVFCQCSMQTVNENDQMRWVHFQYLKRFPMRRNGLYFYMRYLTGPADWKQLPLPDGLFFLYFMLRPFLFVWRKFDCQRAG
jgi:Uncharacterised nucleotidyltransferase